MANMPHCRFRNTASDLADCVENWDELDEEDREEVRARDRIVKLAGRIVEMAKP